MKLIEYIRRNKKNPHFYLAIGWISLVPVILLTSLKESLLVVILMSLYANIESSFAAMEAKKNG